MAWYDILGSIGLAGINYGLTKQMNKENAALNQKYWDIQNEKTFDQNEQAANNAMKRSIDLYNMLQSPNSMVNQLKSAGLNPALMYSNGGIGGHTQSGPQGGAGKGQGAPTLGLQQFMDPLTFAQVENIKADTDKKKEEVENIKKDTLLKESQKALNIQLHDQKAQSFVHELAILAANQALLENDVTMIDTKNQITNKSLELLENDVELRKMEKEFQKIFKDKYGIDISSMDGVSSTLVQLIVRLGEKAKALFEKWEMDMPPIFKNLLEK